MHPATVPPPVRADALPVPHGLWCLDCAFDLVVARSWGRRRYDREWPCWYCGARSDGTDHVVPTCDGGPDTPENTVPACSACNTRKGRASLAAFLATGMLGPMLSGLLVPCPRCDAAVGVRCRDMRRAGTMRLLFGSVHPARRNAFAKVGA